jgi:hypothetical protein
MEKLFTGWGFRILEFCFFFGCCFFFSFFCLVWLQQENILFGLLKVSQAHLELAAVGCWAGSSGQQVGGLQLVGWRHGRLAVQWAGGSVGVVVCLFFQCVMAWRSLTHGLGVQGAQVSALPVSLPQPSVSPASQQGP